MGDILSAKEIDELLNALIDSDADSYRVETNHALASPKKNKQYVKPSNCDNCPKKKTCKGNIANCTRI